MDQGVLYIAMGADFLREAEISAKSCKREMNDIPIALVSDRETESPYFDSITVVDDPDYSFGDVVRYIGMMPFEKTLYLDTDTYLDSDICEVFSVLDEFDVAASPEQSGWHKDHYDLEHPVDGVPEGFPWYNGGVIGLRDNEKVQDFLSRWDSRYTQHLEEGIVHNMISLRHALYFSGVRIATLPRRYNCLFRNSGHTVESVKVFHGRLLDIDSPGASKHYDVEDAIREINSSDEPRVYIPMRDHSIEVIDTVPLRVIVFDPSSNLLYRILHSVKHNGIIETGIVGGKKLLAASPLSGRDEYKPRS